MISMKFEIIPLEGIRPVRLGMTRKQSRLAMNIPYDSYRKRANSPALTDSYLNNSFQVFFDKNDCVEFIELSRGGPFEAFYKGINVFETLAEDLVAFISNDAKYDENDRELGYSYTFPSIELSLWRDILPEDDDEEGRYFWTIGIGRKGYYSESIKQ